MKRVLQSDKMRDVDAAALRPLQHAQRAQRHLAAHGPQRCQNLVPAHSSSPLNVLPK